MSVNPNSVPRTPITDARNNSSSFRPVNPSQRNMIESIDRSVISDYSNTYNPSTGTGGDDRARSLALIKAGFNLRGTGNFGSSGGTQKFIREQMPVEGGKEMGQMDMDFKLVDRIMSQMMMSAQKKGIKSSDEFKSRGEELLREAAGPDYNELVKTGIYPNFITAGSQLYTNKMRNYTPAAAQFNVVQTTRPLTGNEEQVKTGATEIMQKPVMLKKPK